MLDANSDQLDCLADLIFIALLECLALEEASLSMEQLHTRNFTPHPQATRDCICFLAKQGRVVISPITIKKKGRAIQARDTNITINICSTNVSKLIINLSYEARGKIAESNCQQLVTILDGQLKAYECIEYCKFYLNREGLELKEEFVQPYKLSLMIMELAQEQVFKLLWRAVKTVSVSATEKKRQEKFVSLSKLCDLAYKYFLEYRKRDIPIDFYRTPNSIGNSVLRSVVTKYK